jgi:xylulokinase
VLGTSGVVFAVTPEFSPDPRGRVHAFCHAVPGTWHAMGVMLAAAGSLGWFEQVLGGGEPIERLLAEAEKRPPGADGVIFLPYLTGERTPHADPDARGAFAGLHASHGRGTLTRAVLEGVAFGLLDSLELLRETGSSVELGRVSGGGARSALWLEIVASVLDLPLERVAVDEGAAYGAALLGGVAAGGWADVGEAVSACVRPTARIEPNPDWVEVYGERRERFRALYPALREIA